MEVDLFNLLAVEMVPGVSWPRQGEDRGAPLDVVEDDEAAATDLAAPALCTAALLPCQTQREAKIKTGKHWDICIEKPI